MQAIWKDFFVNLTSRLTSGKVEYRISTGGQVVYNGIAVADPSGNCIIRINDICADYLHQSIPINEGKFISQDITRRFVVQYKRNGYWYEQTSVDFYLDWSYDYDFTPQNGVLNAPIQPKYDSRVPFFLSVAGTAVVSLKVRKGGVWQTYTLTYSRDGSFNPSFNISFNGTTIPHGGFNGTWVLPDSVLSGGDAVQFNGQTYDLIAGCGRYALCYVNAHGGWDWLAVREHEKKTDNYTRFSVKRSYDNSHSEGRGRTNYANEIVRSWRFRTETLTDAQSMRMAHLLGSTMVYLYDIAEGAFYPVVITNDSCEYKTFRNNGLERINYDITCELAHDMSRKWILQRR